VNAGAGEFIVLANKVYTSAVYSLLMNKVRW
jgi:hypothetical protein